MTAMLTAGRRQSSLADCVSFALMRPLGIRECLAVGPHFEEQGSGQYAPAV